MSALVWTPTRDLLVAAVAAATSTDKTVGELTLKSLNGYGARYDARYPGAASAKTAWLVAATAAHTAADRLARYVEDLAGTPGAALTFDERSAAAISARIVAAKSKTTKAALASMLATHAGAVSSAYSASTSDVAAYTVAVYTTRSPRALTTALATLLQTYRSKRLESDRIAFESAALAAGYRPEDIAAHLAGSGVVTTKTDDSVREIENALAAEVAAAIDFLAVVAYP